MILEYFLDIYRERHRSLIENERLLYSWCMRTNSLHSHIDCVSGLMQAVVLHQVGREGLGVSDLEIETFPIWVHPRHTLLGTGAVGHVLVHLLKLHGRIAENLTGFAGLGWLAFRDRQTVIKHVLIVAHNRGIASELVIKFVLGVGQDVSFIFKRGGMGRWAVRWSSLLVLSQVGVEGALAMGRSVVSTETTAVAMDVGVTSTTIGLIDNGLRVDVCLVVRWALL